MTGMALSSIQRESLWREYCLLCLQERRTPHRSEFEAWVNSTLSYGDNLALLQSRPWTGKGSIYAATTYSPHQGHSPRRTYLGVVGASVLLLLLTSAVFPFKSFPESGLVYVSAKEAYAVAAAGVKAHYRDAVLVSVRTEVPELVGDQAVYRANLPRYLDDGRALEWRWEFSSYEAGCLIRVTTSGKTVREMETVSYGETPPISIDVGDWRVDSREAARIAIRKIEDSWRSDGQVLASLKLVKSKERNLVLWFVVFSLPGIMVRSTSVVVDSRTGEVLYTMERRSDSYG